MSGIIIPTATALMRDPDELLAVSTKTKKE